MVPDRSAVTAALTVAVVAGMLTTVAMIVLLPTLRRIAIDTPNARSSHVVPTPRGGGLPVILGSLLALSAASLVDDLPHNALVVGLAVAALAVLGLVDDLRGLSQAVRFVVQIAIAVPTLLLLHHDEAGGAWIAIVAVGALWVVAFTNAANFMDGMNGVAGFSASVAAVWYAGWGLAQDAPGLLLVSAALLGGLLAFLPWNYPGARVFLGDVGSYGIGAAQALLALVALLVTGDVLVAVAPLLVSVADTAWTLGRRVARREAWWKAHREHVYQQLTDVGVPSSAVAVVIASTAALCCAAALPVVPRGLGLALTVVVLAAYLALPRMWPTGPTAGATARRRRA